MKLNKREITTIRKAQNVAFLLANLNSKNLTLEEIRHALVVLANFAEDVLFNYENIKEK